MKKILLLTGLIITLLINPSWSQNYEIEHLTDKVLKVKGKKGYHSSYFILTSKGIVVVDTYYWLHQMAEVKPMMEKELNRNDFIYLINTHAHGCHVGGNVHFADIPLIGQEHTTGGINWMINNNKKKLEETKTKHEKAKAELIKLRDEGKDTTDLIKDIDKLELKLANYEQLTRLKPPDITFKDTMTLSLGDITLEFTYIGHFHSDADMVIYIPEEKVLIIGQAFQLPVDPVIPGFSKYYSKAGLAYRQEVLPGILEKDIEKISSSHSDVVLGKKDLEFYMFYITDLHKKVEKEIHNGSTLEEIKEKLQLEKLYSEQIDKERISEEILKVHNRNIETICKHESPKDE